SKSPVIVFDELHKYPKWKAFLKGFFDGYGDNAKVIVTGSSRLDIFKKGGDSLMGRYFLYRMHPFSVGELARTSAPTTPIHKPSPISDEDWNALWVHGGFPGPYLRRSDTFTRRRRSQDANIAGDTAKRWVGVLEQMHFGFRVPPWFKSVANSLRKEPKWFLRDWSGVSDEGPRAETFVGCHLLKSVEGWTDL